MGFADRAFGITSAHGGEVRGFLLMAMPDPSPGNVERLIDDYENRAGMHLYSCWTQGVIVGAIGFAEIGAGEAEITHIAVEEHERRRGIGRAMINAIIERHELRRVEAETVWDTGYFYRACGFSVWSLGAVEEENEIERLRCVWTRAE